MVCLVVVVVPVVVGLLGTVNIHNNNRGILGPRMEVHPLQWAYLRTLITHKDTQTRIHRRWVASLPVLALGISLTNPVRTQLAGAD